MILRRLGEALRRQDWFTVVLEILIVVIGVVLGIQVANWNDDRQDRDAERIILERLSTEVRSLIEIQSDEMASNRDRADRMISAHPVLFGVEPLRELTREECEQIGSSHVFRRPSDELPVLDEIRESDRFDLLTDPELRGRLRDYVLFRERARGRYAELTNELFRLSNLHPELVWVDLVPRESDYTGLWTFLAGEGLRWNVACDAEGMRDSQTFLNHYMDNTARLNSLLASYEEGVPLLSAIETVLVRLPGAGATSDEAPR